VSVYVISTVRTCLNPFSKDIEKTGIPADMDKWGKMLKGEFEKPGAMNAATHCYLFLRFQQS
jgi:hypothetical protein